MRRKWQRAVAAFTLIEVTMVAGIIGGSQGSYAGALKRAKREACAHNLRQLYKGLLMTELTEGRLPEISFYSKDSRKDPHSLLRAVGSSYAPLLVCPTMPEDIKKSGCTYIFNDTLSGKSFSAIRDPVHTWLLMGMTAVVRDKNDPKKLAGDQPHSGGVNVLYADGHVEWTTTPPVLVKPEEKGEAAEEAPPEPKQEAPPAGPSIRLPTVPSVPHP